MSGKSRERDPEATRTAILNAAEKLFIEYGFSQVPVSLIAREAKVTKSLIHHHFKNKEQLWHKVKLRRFEAYTVPQRDSLDNLESNLALLEQSMRNFFEFLQHNRDLVRLMSWMDLEQDPDVIFDYNDLLEVGSAKIRELQRTGEVRDDLDPRMTLMAFLNVIIHWFKARSQWLSAGQGLPDAPETDERYLQNLMKIFFAGITTTSEKQPPPLQNQQFPGKNQ